MISGKGEALSLKSLGYARAHAGGLLWLIKAEPCFLSRLGVLMASSKKKLSFNFHSEVMHRMSRGKMRRGHLKGQSLWAASRAPGFSKVAKEALLALGCHGTGDWLRFPQEQPWG